MVSAALFTLVASILVLAHALQVSLGSNYRQENENRVIFAQDPTEWDLDKLPSHDNTDQLVFETVHSLLQRGRTRSGRNIVPGVIPRGIPLYHGTTVDMIPPGPEWVAMDPEHLYPHCRDNAQVDQRQGCWQLALMTARPLKIIYFDGMTDVQELFLWAQTYYGTEREESQLIQDLCEWGTDLGVDGFVRMNTEFEILLCDFTAGVRVISFTHLDVKEVFNHIYHDPPGWESWAPVIRTMASTGSDEMRIKLDLAGLVSSYDTQLVPSLVNIQASQGEWDNCIRNISREDLLAVKSRLEAALVRPSDLSSGIDWKTHIRDVVDRFAQRLELTCHFLNSSVMDPDEILNLARKVQFQLRLILAPHILSSARPTNPANKTDLSWARPVYRLCATTHIYSLESELESMTDSEKLLFRAIVGMNREICHVVTKMWATGISAGIDQSKNAMEIPHTTEVTLVWNAWAEELTRLMTWLNWSVWVKYYHEHGSEEMCHLPTRPLSLPRLSSIKSFSSDYCRPH